MIFDCQIFSHNQVNNFCQCVHLHTVSAAKAPHSIFSGTAISLTVTHLPSSTPFITMPQALLPPDLALPSHQLSLSPCHFLLISSPTVILPTPSAPSQNLQFSFQWWPRLFFTARITFVLRTSWISLLEQSFVEHLSTAWSRSSPLRRIVGLLLSCGIEISEGPISLGAFFTGEEERNEERGTRNEERGARSEERGARSEERERRETRDERRDERREKREERREKREEERRKKKRRKEEKMVWCGVAWYYATV